MVKLIKQLKVNKPRGAFRWSRSYKGDLITPRIICLRSVPTKHACILFSRRLGPRIPTMAFTSCHDPGPILQPSNERAETNPTWFWQSLCEEKTFTSFCFRTSPTWMSWAAWTTWSSAVTWPSTRTRVSARSRRKPWATLKALQGKKLSTNQALLLRGVGRRRKRKDSITSVSYTHLTLPTILRV